MSKKTAIPLFIVLALAMGAPAAYAEEQKLLAEPYIGIGWGQYNLEFETGVPGDEFDDDQDAIRVFAGTKITKVLGAEVTWFDFDDASDNNIESDLETASLAILFIAPLHERFELFAKAGWFWWDVEFESTVPGTPLTVGNDFDGDDPYFGVGLTIGLTESLDLRFDYDFFDVDERNVNPDLDFASVSLQVNF